MSKYPLQRPNEETPETFELLAVLPHAAGGFAAQEVTVSGASREELRSAAWQRCMGSMYVNRMIEPTTGETVWTETSGWLEDQAETQE